MEKLTPAEEEKFLNYYKLTDDQKLIIKRMKHTFGQTVEEIARRFNITPPDVNRILHPPKDYGKWTAEDKLRHWIAGQRRAATVKKQRDEKK